LASPFHAKGKVLIPRLHRLSHLPPALYATQILQENGFDVLVIEYGRMKEEFSCLTEPLPRLRWASPWAKGFPKKIRPLVIFLGVFLRLLAKIAWEGRPQLIIAHGMQEQSLAFLLGTLFRIPIVVHVHEVYEPNELDRFNQMFHAIGTAALRRARFLIFPEKTRAEIYKKRHHLTAPIHLVFNCPRLRNKGLGQDLRKQLGLRSDALLMAYLGGIGKENALEEAILALIEVPRLVLLIWGWADPNYLTQLKILAKDFGVASRVHFLGELNENKWSVLDGCDLSYCVYRAEKLRLKYAATASNKLMESLASGLPVLTSNHPDFKELVETRNVGLCLPSISSGAVAHSLQTLLLQDSEFHLKSVNGLKAHREDLNFEVQFHSALNDFQKYFKARRLPQWRQVPEGKLSPANSASPWVLSK
jgi:glycosyltransferase involved in cell wall biosynthesis